MKEDSLPDLEAPAATMRDAQLRRALRELRTAYGTGLLSAELYLRLVACITREHPPLAVYGRLWGRQ